MAFYQTGGVRFDLCTGNVYKKNIIFLINISTNTLCATWPVTCNVKKEFQFGTIGSHSNKTHWIYNKKLYCIYEINRLTAEWEELVADEAQFARQKRESIQWLMNELVSFI